MPCRRCRERHYRCDSNKPQCGRCQQANKECVYETGSRFRRGSSRDQSFAGQQQWVPVPPNIQFLDAQEIRPGFPPLSVTPPALRAAQHEGPLFSPVDTQGGFSPSSATSTPLPVCSPAPSSITLQYAPSPSSLINPTEVLSVRSLLNYDSPPEISYSSVPSPAVPYGPHGPVVSQSQYGGLSSPIPYQPTPGPPAFENHVGESQWPQWPLPNVNELTLLRHYIDNVALFFDMVDEKRHFALDLVQLARRKPLLQNAILALSMCHLNRTDSRYADKRYEKIADEYHYKSLTPLGASLSSSTPSAPIADESVVAASIILRLVEEMRIPSNNTDWQTLLNVIRGLIVRDYSYSEGHSRQHALYWAAFRQELWSSLMYHHPFNLQNFPTSPSFEPASDSVWATRTIGHVGEVCNFVFGSDRHSAERHAQLMKDNEAWRTRRPESFDCMFILQHPPESNMFPEIGYHELFHVMGHQYNTLAHALLVANDPTIPPLGPQHKQAQNRIDSEIREDVRTLCGVALSNQKAFPAKLVACFSIALFGDRFTNFKDQQMLFQILEDTERQHGFPTTPAVINQLREAWGWQVHPRPMTVTIEPRHEN